MEEKERQDKKGRRVIAKRRKFDDQNFKDPERRSIPDRRSGKDRRG